MSFRIAATTAAVAAAAATALSAPAAAAPAGHRPPGVVFVQTDEVTGNRIIAYARSADGSLHHTADYPTGGLGGVLDGAVVDHLASQGSLTLDRARHLLYAVNAGSNTVTVFGVHGDRLERLQVIGSGGEFPVSVAVHGDLVYVLNARAGGSVQGFRRIGTRLVRVPGWHRALGLDPAATPEFTHTPGQVAFSPDGSQVLVTTKGNTNAVDVFGVGRSGGLSVQPVHNVEPGAVPFAVAFDAQGHLLVAQAGTNAVASYDLRPSGSITSIATVPTGGAASCWIVGADGTFYVSNTGSDTLSAFRTTSDGGLDALGDTATAAAPIDAATSGRFLYVQTGAEGTVDGFRVGSDGSLQPVGSVTVPGAAGGEGIAAG
ncbi:lactonase family protein [Nucisporomicrobium flavum]|uniref:lactonase family protein n=1 Tax=Nucisporomicrobium flavum TaxID=2785915 RepID=UPI003C2C5FC8